MLTTADYPQCTAQDLHQLAVNNQEHLRNLTGFTFGECADKVKLPMVDKNQDMCDNPYLIKFLAGGRYVCKDYNLTQPITSPGGSCQRAFSAVLCFWRYSDRFLPEGMKCGRDDIIRGLRANRQYLHQSYDRCLDSDVALAYGNVVVANIEGQWRTLCGNWWSDREAKIVCHSLGYKFGIAFNSSMSSMIEEAFGNLRHDSETRSVRCSGNETSLKDCRFEKLEYCWGGGQAGATCFNTELKYELIPAKPGATYGFIKRTADNRTATVSLQWYGERETNLLCQAAGFPYGGIPFPNPLQEEEKDDFYWNAYSSCNGDSATSIEQCVGGSWNYQSAYMDVESANGTVTKTVNLYHRLAQVFCFSGPLRLHNSLLNSTGVAQIRNEEDDSKYDRRQYLGICREGFDNFEASLFCRGLGLGFEGGIALNYLPFRYSFESSNFFNVSCKGGEREFQDCDVERVTMGSCYRPAVVSCTPRLENDKAQEMTVKLFSDNRTIMVYHQDQWGYICGDRWTDVEAETVCRGLNYSSGIAASRSSDSGGYPYLLHNVTCDNNAASLADCLSDDVKSDVCGYEDPAGVFCYNAGDLPSYSLYNGRDASPRYGWAYVTREQTKGRLCSYFHPDTHYRVLCRQLGFIHGEQYRADLPEQEDLPFWGTSFSGCDKDSTSLASCQTAPWEKMQISQGSGSSDGNYTEIVRPYCPYDSIKAFCYNDTVRTHMGFYNTSGVVEVAAANDYYQVCIPYTSYTQEVADVACHQLTSSPTSSAIRIEAKIFSYLTKSVVTVNGTSCHGTEEMLEQCTSKMLISKNSDCYGDRKRLAVVCYDGERPSDNLEMWRIDSESNVMVRRLGMWGHVCSQTWTNKEASAVCKTLGRYDGVVGIGNSWGTRLPTWVERMECPVGADSIQECNITKVDYNMQRQSHYFSCDGRRAACFDQDDVARLFFVDYNSITQPQGSGGRVSRGRVAVEYQGTTGYFCGYSLTQSEENFSTVCRLMGFPRGGQRLNASLPAPSTYNQGWLVEQRCGRWDRTVHYMSCISNWRQEGIRYPGSSELTPCWQNIPAVSCFEDNYRLESSSHSRNQGLLLVWIQDKQQWDQVCRTNFTEMEANAACRQLGLSDSGHVLPAGTLPPNAYYSTAGIRYQCSRSNTDTLDECTIVQDTYCMEDVPVWLSCDVPT
ncbi:hypothetical protein V1264_013581 [Littorina saxatilis]|uniref:SRCR domain-containing protein n=2 Tax=Littorina saxatilis TaxID=31220 RepID=A0AAN9BNG7_9CAEN